MKDAAVPRQVVGVDIGGTKIRAGRVDQDLQILKAVTFKTDLSAGRQSILASVNAAIAEIMHDDPLVSAIGVSTAGVVDTASGTVIDATPALPGWVGTALSEELAKRWQLPVTVENDGKATLVAELGYTPDFNHGITVLLSLGTGLGGAIAIDGQILGGANHTTGHFGITCPLLGTGSNQPLEYYVSGSGLARIWHEAAGADPLDAYEIVAGVRAGDPAAQRARDVWVTHIAAALHTIRWTIDPHWLILAGGVVDVRDTWWAALDGKLDDLGVTLRPCPAAYGSDAAMIGAAKLALRLASPK